jgi:hypothetical protein
VAESTQSKAIAAIGIIRKTEDEANFLVDYRTKDLSNYNQVRNTANYSSSSSSSSRSSSSSSVGYSGQKRKRSRSNDRHKSGKFAEIDDQYQKRHQTYTKKPSSSHFQHINKDTRDMGLLSDGRAIGSVAGGMIKDKAAIGSLDTTNNEDPMDVDSYRMKMSLKYQQNNEDRSRGHNEPQKCYICRVPGHIAKDCKYGLT